MHLTVQRFALKDDRTIGEMIMDGKHFAWTLEDRMRELHDVSGWHWIGSLKVPKLTAIPAGVYEIITSYSERFQRVLPMMLSVPNFEAIRIHGGNGPDNTEGCILVGANKDAERIWNCAGVVAELTYRIRDATASGKVFCEVLNP